MAALPHLDGVDFRMFRGKADYPDFARIITASARGEGDDRVETPEARSKTQTSEVPVRGSPRSTAARVPSGEIRSPRIVEA